MKNYENAFNKKLLVQYLPYIIKNNLDDHKAYFLTIAFNNIHHDFSSSAYHSSFKGIYQKINQLSMNSPSKHPKQKAKMVAFPEKSHQSKIRHMRKANHYHAFLLIDKNNVDRFNRKCVVERTLKPDEEKTEIVQYTLSDTILYQNRLMLKPYSADIQPVSDMQGVSDYMTKFFENPEDKKMNFSLSELRSFQAPSAACQTGNPQNNEFSYDDVELFCDISAFKN